MNELIDYEKVLDDLRHECTDSYDLHDEAADAIEELISRVPKWISVKEKLPDNGEIVAIIDDVGYIHIADFGVGKLFNEQEPWFYVDGEYEPCVMFWLRLPEPPVEKENNDAE